LQQLAEKDEEVDMLTSIGREIGLKVESYTIGKLNSLTDFNAKMFGCSYDSPKYSIPMINDQIYSQ
jgi:hypothetical protein